MLVGCIRGITVHKPTESCPAFLLRGCSSLWLCKLQTDSLFDSQIISSVMFLFSRWATHRWEKQKKWRGTCQGMYLIWKKSDLCKRLAANLLIFIIWSAHQHLPWWNVLEQNVEFQSVQRVSSILLSCSTHVVICRSKDTTDAEVKKRTHDFISAWS